MKTHRMIRGLVLVLAVQLMGGLYGLEIGSVQASDVWRVQVPYEAPPGSQDAPDVSVPPNTNPLSPEELTRAEALLPLLEGKQEFWAMGEFVHLGESSIPVLVKALAMPSPRVRYNAIETLSMMKGVSGVPALVGTAKDVNELPRVREHALRVAIRLNPSLVPEAIEVMAADLNPSVKKAAAFEARYVRHKAVIPVLISMVTDDERFVALSALHSLWILTRHETEFHDWETSTKQDRAVWVSEWVEWWNDNQQVFEIPEPPRPKRKP
ncbi:MAG: HEAT repeat domain-containing protein [Nitrospira sp.]|nr:HEAT repeat domain-containing protein [Nitrospira sp.]MBH0183065.1 HEAT repeat domain-containing protein [Nitrospira sp.]MBH0185614.1 HEAT repeat domain-containing protein [Nitrospira sp.]MBH0189219.1 HEAT repeat domain-containing protein [Nitrospira sp.]MBH0195338.1 HEAT repeat domain-containing protein [Nitrospira sp.]